MSIRSNTKNNINNDDLICPITLDILRDPVIAGDGHIYERVAIVRWIEEHGTSPLTRQPLNITELQTDDYLKSPTLQRQSSMNLYNCNINVDYLNFQQESLLMSYNYNINQSLIIPLQIMANTNIPLINNAEQVFDNNIFVQRCLIMPCILLILLASCITISVLPNMMKPDHSSEFSMNTSSRLIL